MKLSIIIINYNTPELVLACLRSIKKWIKIPYEVIVVENGSKINSRMSSEELDKVSIDYKLVISENNLGFGRGNNLGAKEAKGEYVWFLNSDTLIVDDSIHELISFLDDHEEVGAVSPVLYHDDGSIQSNFFAKFQSLGSVLFRRYNFQPIDFKKKFFYVDVIVGAALLTRRKIFEKIDGFDPNIFMYLEDDDLCKRIVDLGYKNAVYTQSKIIHLEGRSINRNSERKKLYYNSQTYFWRKHNGLLPTIIMQVIRWPYKLIKTKI